MDVTKPRVAAAAVAATALVAITIIAARSCGPKPASGEHRSDPPSADWCAPGLEPIAGGGCLASATSGTRTPTLLIYLHGRYAPTAAGVAEELDRQARVAKLGASHNFAVLALRGSQGRCTTPELRDWWCWPSNERNLAMGPEIVASWSTAIAAAEARAKSKRRVLLGFSNGGYFAALIATRALMPLDAITIAHAGPAEPTKGEGKKPPILLLTADEDVSIESMMLLDGQLSQDKWPHVIGSRDGGHALPDSDIQTALTFFSRTEREGWPLSPPVTTRPPRPNVPKDAGVDAPTTAPAEPVKEFPEASAPSAPAEGEDAGE